MVRQQRKKLGVYKPRKHGRKWRVMVRNGATGAISYCSYSTEEAAKRGFRRLRREKEARESPAIPVLVNNYQATMIAKGNKKASASLTADRLARFFETCDKPAALIDAEDIETLFRKRMEGASADTARNTLAEVKTFFRWLVKTGQVGANPAEKVDGSMAGRRRKGKPQLRPHEAKRFLERALSEAAQGNRGSLACAMALLLGLRQSEITLRKVRDVDRFTRTLHIEEAKTEAGNRVVEIPDLLWPLLEEETRGRDAMELLFPGQDGTHPHLKEWATRHAKRLCRDLGLPPVCAHGLRGTHASLAQRAGVTAHLVAQQLGHTNVRVTQEHYTAPGLRESVDRKTVFGIFEGGRA